MKRLLFSAVLVGILLSTNLTPQMSYADGSTFQQNAGLNVDQTIMMMPQVRSSMRQNIRKKAKNACTALLVTSTIALSGFYTYTGQLHEKGLGARVVWAPERRAIVVLLLRALKLPAGNTSGAVARHIAFESRENLPQNNEDEITAEDIDEALQLTEFTPERSAGLVMLKSQPFSFEMDRQASGAVRFMIKSLGQ